MSQPMSPRALAQHPLERSFNHAVRARGPSDKYSRIQRRAQLRNAIVERFKQKHLSRESVPKALLGHLLDEMEKQIDKFLKAERLSQDKLQKLDGLLHDLVQKEIVSYQRDGIVRGPRTRKHAPTRSQVPSLRSDTPLGLSGVSSVVSERARSLRSSQGHSVFSDRGSRPQMAQTPSAKVARTLNTDEDMWPQTTSLNIRASLKKHTEWNRIVQYNTAQYKADMQRLQDEIQEKRMKQRNILEDQINERKQQKVREREELMSYWKRHQKQLDAEEQREQEKQQKLRDKAVRQKEERMQQVQQEKARKTQLLEEERAKEAKHLKNLKEKIKIETEEIQKKKETAKEHYRTMIKENIRLKQEAVKAREVEKQQAVELQKRYQEYQDAQFKKQQEEKQERVRRIEARMEKMADVVLKNEREKELQEEKIFLRQIAAKEKAEKERERIKRESHDDELRRTRAIIAQQLVEKQDRRKNAQQEEADLMRRMVSAEKSKQETFKAQESAHKEKEKAQARFLLRQIRDKDEEGSKMNENELLLNKQLLSKIPRDI